MTDYDADLEKNMLALIDPKLSDMDAARKVIDIAGTFVTIGHPAIGLAVKGATWTGGFFLDKKKSERVMSVILGLHARLQKLEGAARDYVRKPEAQAIVEDALIRIANQPDESRQQDMRRILQKIVEQPRDPAESKLLLRLADELPVPALKLLAVLHPPSVTTTEPLNHRHVLAARADLSEHELKKWLRYLANENLIEDEYTDALTGGVFETMLTNLGKLFEHYRRG